MQHYVVRRIGSLVLVGALTSALTLAWSALPASAAPANDDWGVAADVSNLVPPSFDPALPGVSIDGTTAGATREAGEPVVDGAAALGTVWYRYTAPAGSRLGQLGYRVTDRSGFVVAAYTPYVQDTDPVPYPGENIPSLAGMNRIQTTGYDQFGVLPGDASGGFLPTVRVEPGATVWFQVSANPDATPPADGAFTFELFSVGHLAEGIGRTGADIRCADPFGCSSSVWGDTSAASPAAIGPASTWAKFQVTPGAPLNVVVRSENDGFRASTRPVSVSVYLHPAGLPDSAPVTNVGALGAPIAQGNGGVEVVDARFGRAGTANQWVVRLPDVTGGTTYHVRVDGDPTFVNIFASTPGRAVPIATITDPSDGAVYASPADVPALAYTCTEATAPITSSAVTVDGSSLAAGQPLPTSSGAHTIRVVCEDADGATSEAIAVYRVGVQFDVPNQAITVDEDSTQTADLLAAVTLPSGEFATLTSVGSPANGTVSITGGSVTYTPAADFAGSDQFSYTVTSSSGVVRTAVVMVTVNPINDAPVAVDDTLTVNAGSAVEIDLNQLVANDTDIDGPPLVVNSTAIVAPSIGGQLTSCTGTRPTCTLYAAPTTSGVEFVDYEVSDGAGGTDTGRLTITVVPSALPDKLLVKLTCPGGEWYNVGGPTTGLTVRPGPFGLTLLSGRVRLGTGVVTVGLVVANGGVTFGSVTVSDSSNGVNVVLRPRNASIAIGSTWVMTGSFWRNISGSVFQRCTFQVNVSDGG